VASRSQTALLSGLGHALTQATGRQPDDLCHRKGTSHLPDHGRDRRRLTKPKSFRSGVLVQNVQTPDPGRMPWAGMKQALGLKAKAPSPTPRLGSGERYIRIYIVPIYSRGSGALLSRLLKNSVLLPGSTPGQRAENTCLVQRVESPTSAFVGVGLGRKL
jgi:hypothetical protein